MDSTDRQESIETPGSHNAHLPAVRVLMLGCGRMGGALLRQWQREQKFSFTVVSPSGRRSLPETVSQVRCAAELGDQNFDIIVIAVKPQMIAEVLPDYRDHLAPDGVFVSLAAGFSCNSLSTLVQTEAVVRVMPNLPVSLGKGVSGLYAKDQVEARHRDLVEALMQSTGHLLWVTSEDELDRFTAIAGSGPGYAFEIARCWVQAGEALGFSRAEARSLVLKTLEGAVDLALSSDAPLSDLREEVTSKNGATQAGLLALNGDTQLDVLFNATVFAAYERTVALR